MPPIPRGGIKFGNLDPSLANRIPSLAAAGNIAKQSGVRASNILRIAANVADTETVKIGADTYEVETVATAIGGGAVAAGGTFNSTADPKLITVAAHGLAVGDVIACQAEICQILRVPDANSLVVSRGRYGTTAATHADGQTINKGNGITAGNIPVGFIATFTPAVAGPAFADAINNAKHGTERHVLKASTIFASFQATSLLSGVELLVEAVSPGVDVTACTETLAGANNVWSAATMTGGLAAGDKGYAVQSRVPTATEVALGVMEFSFPFAPRLPFVQVITTATGVNKGWNGAIVITGNRMTVDNSGATDWAATDTVYVTADE